ncbi:MAG: 30S ribosomal protein S12 methylthiotransferase RimO [Candidatus Hydrogenedentes bacterium]|nr:30S ribosomal protein S12 methylthiotransferase RimO [Candidatus Hydrogenedentota bacterium]
MIQSADNSRKERVLVVNLGCPKNLCDTESMMGELAESGHSFVADPADATAVLINTCTFIEDATIESLDTIVEFANMRQAGDIRLLVVAGCLAQRDPESLREQFPEVDAWLGTGDFGAVVEAFAKAGRGETFCRVNPPRLMPESKTPRFRTTPAHYAYIKIADGCSNRCSYCIIPSLRGPYRSRSVDAVVEESEQLADSGTRELILVAQDVTRFGEDRGQPGQLPDLLSRLDSIDAIRWIRIMYAYPARITDRLIESVASLPKVVHYIDMPIQHADLRMLKAMNRSDTPETLRACIERIRTAIPDVALRTSVMVGFPGETDEMFSTLLEFIDEIKFDRLGAFCYSAEDGTPAATMDCQVSKQVADERLDAVMRLQQTISQKKHDELVGRRLQVIMDGPDIGRTYRDAPDIDGTVNVTGYSGPPGEFVDVNITTADVYDLGGYVTKSK